MNRRDENIELWTETVEEQFPDWSFTTTVGAISTITAATCLIWVSVLVVATDLTLTALIEGNVSLALITGLTEFSYFTFSMAIAVCLTKYIWYIYRSPDKIADDVDILTPSIIIIFTGGVILIFLSILDRTLNPDVGSVITLYYLTSYFLLGVLGVYITSVRYVKENELEMSVQEYKEEMKEPTEDDIVVLSNALSFNAIVTTLISSAIVLITFHMTVGDLSLVDLSNGNISLSLLFGVMELGYFILAVSIGLFTSIGIWYIYSLPDEITSEIELPRVFVTVGLIGGLLVILAVIGSSVISVSDGVLYVYYIISHVLMLFVVIAMSSVHFHKDSLGDELTQYKSEIQDSRKKHKNLIEEYERLQSQAPEAITVNLESDKFEPFGKPNTEQVFERNAQLREAVEEYRDKIRKHTDISERLKEVEMELDSAAGLLSDAEFVTSKKHIERATARLEELDDPVSECNFEEFRAEINNLQQRVNELLSDLNNKARTHVQGEIASVESDLANLENQIKKNNVTDANETIDDIRSQLDTLQDIATEFEFEGLQDELESLMRRREALLEDIETDITASEALSKLDSTLDRAEESIEERELENAAEILTRSNNRLNSVKHSFSDSVDDSEQIPADFDELVEKQQQRYQQLRSELEEQKREELEGEKDSIQSDFETVKTYFSEGRPTDANKLLSDIEAQLDLVQESASQWEFPDLKENMESMERDHAQLHEAVPIIELHEDVNEAISTMLEEAASQIEDGQLTQAFNLLTTCRSRVRELEDSIKQFEDSGGQIDLIDFIDKGPEEHYGELRQREREYIKAEVRSMQSAFESIERQMNEGKFEKAQRDIQGLDSIERPAQQQYKTAEAEDVVDELDKQFESRFTRVKDVAIQAGLEEQQDAVDTLERKQTELTGKIDQLQKFSNELDSLREEIDDIDQTIRENDYDTAKEELIEFEGQLNKIEEELTNYETAALDNEITTLRQRREQLLEELETTQQRGELAAEVTSLRSQLEDAQSLADEDLLQEASIVLGDIEPKIQSLQTSVAGFEELENNVQSMQDWCEELQTKVTTRIKQRTVPKTIPREPNISIEYQNISDKEHIGGGGNADVSKANYPTSNGDVTVAIKEPRVSGTLHTEDVERVIDEARTWNKLDDHDHIVGVVDYGSEPLPWIAMEYMDGGHLGEYTDMDIKQKIWTAYVVTEGVLHAHRRGVAHLDLKPENILFRSVENGWNIPKVSDWGLSKHLLEHSKSIEGLTVEYAAPEQFDDEYGVTDDFTDIYQLGTVFYELFTGEPLYEGQPFTVMNQIINKSPTPPSDVADVPTELDDILLTALSKDKNDRYSHVVYLRDALEELVGEF